MKAILFIVIWTLVFFGIGYLALSRNLALIQNGVSTTATVLENKTHYDEEGDKVYCPHVEMKLRKGFRTTLTLNECSTPAIYSKGEVIPVIYEKNKPQNVIVNSTFWIYIFPGIFIRGYVHIFIIPFAPF